VAAGDRFRGVRLPDVDDLVSSLPWPPGAYRRVRGSWWIRTPDGNHYGVLTDHTIEEHADGTVTVSPSILSASGRSPYHGYLRSGVWEEV
jgi:hypothetical protein